MRIITWLPSLTLEPINKGKNAYYHLVAFFNARTYKHLDRISLERTFI
jgi:hypothetical protein